MPEPVAIVGAGAAGLAAARELKRHGVEVVVYEAARRIGGRVLTRHPRGVGIPLELGAEFLHGDAPLTHALAREAGLATSLVRGEYWTARGGHLARRSPLPAVDRVLATVDAERPDESLTSFLDRRRSPSARRSRSPVLEFVSGYHAADPERIGVQSLASDDGPATEAARCVGRVVPGTGTLLATLARPIAGAIRLDAAVRRIEWKPGRATLTVTGARGRTRRVAARAVVVTPSIGVLQHGASGPAGLLLDPDPPALRRALACLRLGAVVKIALAFRERLPWQRVAGRSGKDVECLAFLRTPGGAFNVWWSAFPLDPPVAVAWSGGPAATRLARGSAADAVATALGELARALGVHRDEVRSEVAGWWMHDWSADPFTRGAYSYAQVGGSGAGAALARPVHGTLFLAGEATDEGSGTVEGALASGARAARQVLAALSRSTKARRRDRS